jgi:ABC-2 type transport system ATP-binding protein
MTRLEFRDIRRAYETGRDVLHDVTFSLQQGEVVGLLGRNGAGKTTLIRIAMGMLAPDRGTVSVLGMDPRRSAVDVKRRVGYVSEEQVLPSFLTVREIIALHRTLFPTWDEEKAAELLHGFRLPLLSRISRLSKGQARQVALTCAVSHRPEVLILDEPAGGLDPAARREFLETSIRLLNEEGTTILFSSHYMQDVERVAERVVLLHDGRVIVDRSVDELRESHCVALIPLDHGVKPKDLTDLDGCLGVRERTDALHAVMALSPEDASAVLSDRLGVRDARCRQVALEEMFIELVGGQRS